MPATVTTPSLPDIAEIERTAAEASARADALASREQALALDALGGDEKASAELASVQAERDECLLSIHNAGLARAEHGRLTEQAAQDAERERIEREIGKAQGLAKRYREIAARVDADAMTYARTLAELAQVKGDLDATVGRAGERALSPAGSAVQASLILALRTAQVPGSYIDLAGISPRPAPLAEQLPRQPFERN